MNSKKHRYLSLRYRVLSDLDAMLDKRLTYHTVGHTLDVCNACNQYIRRLDLPQHERLILRTAALLHDYGFTVTYSKHEKAGCKLISNMLPEYGYSKGEIEQIKKMILATQIPQNPKDELSKILCDSDLDYLGRNDFKKIGDTLFQEFKNYGILKTRKSWNELQAKFLKVHYYHTPYAQKYRQPVKQAHLKKVEALLSKNSG